MKNNNRVLLVNPCYKVDKSISKKVLRYEPPVGLLNLASYMDMKGYSCDILNTALDDFRVDKDYLFVGFTVFIGEFMDIARRYSMGVDVPVVYGGVMPSLYPELFLKNCNVDFVVRGEGERTLFELAEYLNGDFKLEDIDGLSYWDNDGGVVHNKDRVDEQDLDVFPVPKWELFDGYVNREQVPYFFRIMGSKGCPFECSFCYNKDRRWRYRSAEHVIAEIDYINKLTGSVVFTFGDDNFLLKKDRAFRILDYLKRNSFFVEQLITHVSCLDDDMINRLSGVVKTVIYSIESASVVMQQILNKNIDLSRVLDVNKKLYDNGITTTHNFIIGLPGESIVDLRKNVELMLKLKDINPFVRGITYFCLPLPGTKLADGLKLPGEFEDFASMTFGFDGGLKFRPWLSEEDFLLLRDYSLVFDDVFQIMNKVLSDESKDILKGSRVLCDVFDGIGSVNSPVTDDLPYILDEKLGEGG